MPDKPPISDDARRACLSCRHYHISWDPSFPHGCRRMGFKSQGLPCLTVIESSGEPCHLYEPKPVRRP